MSDADSQVGGTEDEFTRKPPPGKESPGKERDKDGAEPDSKERPG